MTRNLLNILKTNVACCKAAGNPFITQLSRLYIDLLSLYRILSEKVSVAVEQNGQEVLKVRIFKRLIFVICISSQVLQVRFFCGNVKKKFFF